MTSPHRNDFLELARIAPPDSAPLPERDRFYVSEAGVLRQLDANGNDDPVAGPGALPNPTDDGDVLTVVEGEWAGAPGGGSQPGAQRWIGPHTVFANMLQVLSPGETPPDGGSFKLSYDGELTEPIAWDATGPEVQAALSALPSLAGPMMVTVYECITVGLDIVSNFPAPGALPGILGIVIVNTADRPLPLTIEDSTLTNDGLVVDFNAYVDAWYCIADLDEGDIVIDAFVARIEDFLGSTALGFYNANKGFLFPGNQYIPIGDSAASSNLPDFTHNENAPQSAQMTDASNYGEIPTLALTDADLFVNVLNRGDAADDSAGEYRLYLAVATPAPIS